MKRRELIKSAVIAAGGALTLSGCKSSDNTKAMKDSELDIKPKQTDVYKFSVPLTFNHDSIDEFAKLNQKYKKSQIDVLYNNLPWPATEKFNELFQTRRGENKELKTFADFAKYAKHAMDNGFEVCYLINSPKPFNDKDIKDLLPDFYKLLDDIYNCGIRNIKIASPQVAELINKHNSEFELTASVLFEYHNVAQYKYLLGLIPNIKRIVVTKDENQNFKYLKNLRKMFPDVTLEMMLDEGCIKGCPSRYFCMSDSETTNIGNRLGCYYTKNYKYSAFYKNGVIYPWDLGYYSAIGINNFKLVQMKNRAEDKNNLSARSRMDIVEYGLESELLRSYIYASLPFSHLLPPNIETKKLLSLFPVPSYFVKNGHKCESICGVECDYCDKRAQELIEFVGKYT